MLLPVCLRFYFSGACAVLSKQLIDLFLTSNDWFFHDIILYHVAPEVITKPKTVGFLKTAETVGAIYLVICLCPLDSGGKKINKTRTTLPTKKESASLWMNEWSSVLFWTSHCWLFIFYQIYSLLYFSLPFSSCLIP